MSVDTDAPAQPDTGVGEDVVTVTAPKSLNWGLIGLLALAAWWVFNNLSGDTDED